MKTLEQIPLKDSVDRLRRKGHIEFFSTRFHKNIYLASDRRAKRLLYAPTNDIYLLAEIKHLSKLDSEQLNFLLEARNIFNGELVTPPLTMAKKVWLQSKH